MARRTNPIRLVLTKVRTAHATIDLRMQSMSQRENCAFSRHRDTKENKSEPIIALRREPGARPE